MAPAQHFAAHDPVVRRLVFDDIVLDDVALVDVALVDFALVDVALVHVALEDVALVDDALVHVALDVIVLVNPALLDLALEGIALEDFPAQDVLRMYAEPGSACRVYLTHDGSTMELLVFLLTICDYFEPMEKDKWSFESPLFPFRVPAGQERHVLPWKIHLEDQRLQSQTWREIQNRT